MTATTTVIGNLTAAPELRFTQNGLAVVNFTVASTDKVFDKATNEFKDGKTLFMRCSAWRELAEHIAGSLDKGNRVIVVGKISTREYETTSGDKRSTIEMDVDAVGPDLRWATAAVTRAAGGRSDGSAGTQPQSEPWAASAPAQPAKGGDVWSTPSNLSDDTPF